jgi:uncharacterized protein (TIGR00661 family)
MGKILYSLMGDARGHFSRCLSVAQHMPEHEYLFLGGGNALEFRELGYHAEELPMLATYYKHGRLDIAHTVGNAARILTQRDRIVQRAAEIIRAFDPDLILTDYEYFTPLAAERLDRPCYSLDHQHALTHCRYERPPGQLLARALLFAPLLGLYSKASRFLVSSFFELPPKAPNVEVFGPILRRLVKDFTPCQGEHALVYMSLGVSENVLPLLEGRDRKFLIYGFGERPARKNLEFRPKSIEGFMRDLASCSYVVSNGGHSLLSEALYFGKPVLCFPIPNLYEQFINGHFLEASGFGLSSLGATPRDALLDAMESRRESFAAALAQRNFWGNDRIATRLNELMGLAC